MMMKNMKLWLLVCVLMISIISIIRLIKSMIMIDKISESLFVNNNDNNNNNNIVTTNSTIMLSSIISTQQHESTSLMNNNNNNLIRKGISSCYKTRLRMVYPLYGHNGCINENQLNENNLLGSTKNKLLSKGSYGGKTRIYCRFYHYKIQLKHLKFYNYGGENMNDVIGQNENVEYIKYQSTNAFIISEQSNQSSFVQQQINNAQNYKIHYMTDVLSHTTIQNVTTEEENNDGNTKRDNYNNNNEPKCTQYIKGTTYFIQRYEYVNLFHTMTDWWNTWLAIDSIDAATEQQYNDKQQKSYNTNIDIDIPQMNHHKKQITFLDSHPNGILDDVWNILFHNYSYIGQYVTTTKSNKKKKSWFGTKNEDDVLCFDDTILVPAGYSSEFVFGWYDDTICKDYITTERFVNYVLDHFHITDNNHPMNDYHFLYIDRRPYISHPRAKLTKFERIITNLEQVAITVQQYVNSTFNVSSTYEIIQLDQYNMLKQIQKIRTASILFGYHGAGLTHLLFLHYNAGIIEIQHGSGGDLFMNMAKWKKKLYNISYENGTISQHEDIIHYQLIPSLYSRHMTDQYIQTYLLPAFHSIIVNQQQQQKLKRNTS